MQAAAGQSAGHAGGFPLEGKKEGKKFLYCVSGKLSLGLSKNYFMKEVVPV